MKMLSTVQLPYRKVKYTQDNMYPTLPPKRELASGHFDKPCGTIEFETWNDNYTVIRIGDHEIAVNNSDLCRLSKFFGID